MKQLFKRVVAACCFSYPFLLGAQTPGSLDGSFTPMDASSDIFWGVAIQPDGKIIAVGREGSSSGVIYRLNVDGSVDSPFLYGARASCLDSTIPQINTVALQTNGGILLGGQFTQVDSVTCLRLARLNQFGALDSTFTAGAGDSVFACVVQPDGKILLGGNFLNFRGSGKHYLARINPDGSVDGSFNPQGAGPQARVYALALGSQGEIVVGGDFTSVNGLPRLRIARLSSDGTVDPAFDTSSLGPDNSVTTVAVQADGKVVLGGSFLNVAGASRGRIARLNTDGTLDTSFDPGSGCDNYTVWAVAIQPNGKILAGGRFTSVNGNARSKIVRFTSNGAIDSAFDPTAGSGTLGTDEIRALALQSDGKIIVAGKFTTFSGQTRYGIARLYGDPVIVQPYLVAQATSTNLVLSWTGPFTLQSSTNAAGQYFDVPGGPTSPCVVPFQYGAEFFRLRN